MTQESEGRELIKIEDKGGIVTRVISRKVSQNSMSEYNTPKISEKDKAEMNDQ